MALVQLPPPRGNRALLELWFFLVPSFFTSVCADPPPMLDPKPLVGIVGLRVEQDKGREGRSESFPVNLR